MSNNNVAIVSLMAQFDEKSVNVAAEKLGKTTAKAFKDIGKDELSQDIVSQFTKAMNTVKGKLKGVNLSSYTNNILDSIISDKDIAEKIKELEDFISNIKALSKSLSGLDSNALNSMNTKQLDAIINKQKKIEKKNEEIINKTKSLNSTANSAARTERSTSSLVKKYGVSDYEQSYESLKKVLQTNDVFNDSQQKSIKHLSEMLSLYSDMEKVQPEKGTKEAISYSVDLLTIVKEIQKTSQEIDLYTSGKASKFVNKNYDLMKSVNEYNVESSKSDFVKSGLSALQTQKAKLEKELTEYIGKSVEKNLQKMTDNSEKYIDSVTKKAEKLQTTIDTLSQPKSDKPLVDNIVDESQIKSLEEIEDRLLDLQDKYLETDANGYAVNDLDTKELKEFISLYNEYTSLLPKDNKFESDLPDTYKSIIDSDEALQKYADSIQKVREEKQKLEEVKNNTEVDSSKHTEELKEQQQHIEKTEQAEKDLQETHKASSNTIINVDTEQALSNINAVKESLESLPSEKNIKISVNNTDYSSVPLLSNEEGKTVNMFRGIKNAWSGLVNDKGIGFFTDKLELAVDYADELAKDGKVIQANLALHNPLEVDGNGARWDQINFEGVKQKTDDIIEKAKQLGYDGVIFKNIRDGFTDTEADLSNVVAIFDAMSVKNEQVVGVVKAGTGELTKIESELKETQVKAENTVQAIKEVTSVSQESNISSENVTSAIEGQNKIQEELDETVAKINNVGKAYDTMAYRGIEAEEAVAKASKNYNGATHWSSDEKIARGYGDIVTSGNISLKNAFEVDGNGAYWDKIQILGDGLEENSKKAIEFSTSIDKVYSELSTLLTLNGDFNKFNPGFTLYSSIGEEISKLSEEQKSQDDSEAKITSEKIQRLAKIRDLYADLVVEYDKFSRDTSHPYGLKTTDELTKYAQANGYDGAIYKNIIDAKHSPIVSGNEYIETSNIIVSFYENQVKYLEKISRKGQEYIRENISNLNTNSQMKDVFQGETEKSGMDAISSATEDAVQSKKDFATANEGVQSSIDDSENPLKLEAELMDQIAKSALEASDAKKEFVEANKQVKDSADDSDSELDNHHEKKKQNDSDIQKQKDAFNKSNLSAMDMEIQKREEEAKINSSLLKSQMEQQVQYENQLKKINSTAYNYRNDVNGYKKDSGKTGYLATNNYLQKIEKYESQVKSLESYVSDLHDQEFITDKQLNKLEVFKKRCEEAKQELKDMKASDKGSWTVDVQKEIDKINSDLSKNSNYSKQAKEQLKAFVEQLKSGNISDTTLKAIHEEFLRITNAEKLAGREGKNFFDIVSNSRLHQIAAQLAGMFSIYDVINAGREGINVVRELDTALTEMRKVSSETVQSLKDYQSTTFDTADSVGTTAKQIQNSTADWMRLGESMSQAAKSAKDSNILLNVSEFDSIDEATESLVSMSQAYKDLDKMDIINVLNNIGNNYSISTDGLATALKDSASALVTANNDLNEAVSLTTAGNAITQDPSKVGAGLRTISLRLVGTEQAKQELSDLGEETDGMITTVSKLRDTIMDATKAASADGKGFDILDDNGNYKSTYEIMQGLADLYDDIVKKDKELGTNNLNLLLETIAGKNRSNIAASILQNGDMLRSVYEDAQNSDGSAENELNSYLDSIDGKWQQLTNRVQEFWSKLIDSEAVKNGIDLLSTLLKGATDFVEALDQMQLTIPTLLGMLGSFGMSKLGDGSLD